MSPVDQTLMDEKKLTFSLNSVLIISYVSNITIEA